MKTKKALAITALVLGVLILVIPMIVSLYVPGKMWVEMPLENTVTEPIGGGSIAPALPDPDSPPAYQISVKSFVPFVNTYHLWWLLAIGLALIVFGVIHLFKNKRMSKQRV